MKHLLVGVCLAFVVVQAAGAQAPRPVTWSMALAENTRVEAGAIAVVLVTARIDSGWHLYAMSQPPGGPIATTVTVPEGQPFSLNGKVLEPQPAQATDRNFNDLVTRYFDNLATFTVPVRVAAGTKPGRHTLRLSIEYQACTASMCLRPITAETSLEVTVNAQAVAPAFQVASTDTLPDRRALAAAEALTDAGEKLKAMHQFGVQFPNSELVTDSEHYIFDLLVEHWPDRRTEIVTAIDRIVARIPSSYPIDHELHRANAFSDRLRAVRVIVDALVSEGILLEKAEAVIQESLPELARHYRVVRADVLELRARLHVAQGSHALAAQELKEVEAARREGRIQRVDALLPGRTAPSWIPPDPTPTFPEDQRLYERALGLKDPVAQLDALTRLASEDRQPLWTTAEKADDVLLNLLVTHRPDRRADIEQLIDRLLSRRKYGSRQSQMEQAVKHTQQALTPILARGILLDKAETVITRVSGEIERRFEEIQSGLLLQQGRVALARGDTTRAEASFMGVVAVDPSVEFGENPGINPEARLGLASIELSRGRDQAGLEHLLIAAVMQQRGPADTAALHALFQKVHGSLSGLDEAMDAAYLTAFPNPIVGVPYAPGAARTERLVLVELFTGSGCAPCSGSDIAHDALLRRFPADTVAAVAYHVSNPQPDPMATAGSDARDDFYGGGGVPRILVDGKTRLPRMAAVGGAREEALTVYANYLGAIEPRLEVPPEVAIDLKASIDGVTITVSATVSDVATGATDAYVGFVLAEKQVRFAGENGSRFHPMVARAVAGGSGSAYRVQGSSTSTVEHRFDLVAVKADLVETLRQTLETRRKRGRAGHTFRAETGTAAEIDPSALVVVAFVQDAQKNVLQAAQVALGDLKTAPKQIPWPDSEQMGAVSPDGRYMAFRSIVDKTRPRRSPAAGSIMELATGAVRTVIPPSVEEWIGGHRPLAWSNDGTRLAYSWCRPSEPPGGSSEVCELRVMAVAGGMPRVLLPRSNGQLEVHRWSPDDQHILVLKRRTGAEELALVSAGDGSERHLELTNLHADDELDFGAGPFSPDGRFVAYTRTRWQEQPYDSYGPGDVFILDLEAGTDRSVIAGPASDHFVAWTPDGRGLVLSTDRSGSIDLVWQGIADGVPTADVSVLARNVGSLHGLAMTRDGDLFFKSEWTDTFDVQVADLDPASGLVTSTPRSISVDKSRRRAGPAWSRDGTQLAYRSGPASPVPTFVTDGYDSVTIHTMADGRERTVRISDPCTPQWHYWALTWPADQRSALLSVSGAAAACRGIHVVDLDSGNSSPLVKGTAYATEGQLLSDDRSLLFARRQAVVLVDPHSGVERTVLDLREASSGFEGGTVHALARSHTGDRVALAIQTLDRRVRLAELSLTDGRLRVIHDEVQGGNALWGGLSWSADDRFLLYAEEAQVGRPGEVWRVPVAGGPPQKIGLRTDSPDDGIHHLRVSPNGRMLAFQRELTERPKLFVIRLALPSGGR